MNRPDDAPAGANDAPCPLAELLCAALDGDDIRRATLLTAFLLTASDAERAAELASLRSLDQIPVVHRA